MSCTNRTFRTSRKKIGIKFERNTKQKEVLSIDKLIISFPSVLRDDELMTELDINCYIRKQDIQCSH